MSRILILDDDRAVLNCFETLLAQTGRYESEVLSDSTRAVQVIAAGRFDLILLDMDMPVVSGMEVLRYVRQEHPGIAVVVITGVGDVELAVESMKLGAFDYLCKPVNNERLVACLDRALEGSRRREELHLHPGARGAAGPALQGGVQGLRHAGQDLDADAGRGGADRGQQQQRADLGRERHRQGAGGPRHPPAGDPGRASPSSR